MNSPQFVDIHSHCLPGVDDGCKDIDETLAMLKRACEKGTRRIVATPHMFTDLFGNYDFVTIREHFDSLTAELHTYRDRLPFLKQIGVDLGAENYVSTEFFDALSQGCVLTLNGSRYLLVEVSPMFPLSQIRAALARVFEAGYVPVLAHTERIRAIQEEPSQVEEIWRQGCVVQINGDSLLRGSGSRSRHCAKRILAEGLVDVIASDGHRPNWRPPDLSEVFEKLKLEYHQEDILRWMADNPSRILANSELSEPQPDSR